MSKLLIVEDSDITRNEVKIIAIESGLFDEVITAKNGEEGIKQVIKGKPDACILDLEMPRMGGFTFLKWLMANRPIPALVFSSLNTDENIMKALEIGAVDFLGKTENYITSSFKKKLIEKLAILKHSSPSPLTLSEKTNKKENTKTIHKQNSKYKIIILGASTGGPTAIQKILKDIDGKISLPVIVCQHMPKNFTLLFAQRLNNLLKHYQVKEARNGDTIENGKIFVCPGEFHLLLNGKNIKLIPSKASDLYSPSIDTTFESAAAFFRDTLLGIILTGMGKDGFQGAKKIKESGGTIIAQSPESCVVYGMPKEIVKNNLHDYQLSIEKIGEKIVELCTEKN